MLLLVGAAAGWAAGSLYARGAALPKSPLLSASMQMLSAGVFLGIAGLSTGEASDVSVDSFSAKPVIAVVYLALIGSIVAFSAYAWLLKNVRISIVATYAFVNPVVAVVLGTIFLSEPLGWTRIIAGAAIVVAVVLIVTARAPAEKPVTGEAPEALKAAA
jgi:drug/metabolite transporter (DMT)-like permease